MKVLIDQLSEYSDMDEFTYFLVYQSVRSTVTLINQNFEMQNYILEYLEWLLINTQRFLKLNINQIQPLVSSTLQILTKNQPSNNDKLLYLLNILKKLSDQNTDHQINYKNVCTRTLQEDIIAFLSQQNENTDIIQNLQRLKLKVSVILNSVDIPITKKYIFFNFS